jgi:hypothetical protein
LTRNTAAPKYVRVHWRHDTKKAALLSLTINARYSRQHIADARRGPFAAANCSNSASPKLSSNSGQRRDAANSDIFDDRQHTSRKPIGRCFLYFRPPHQPALPNGKAMKAAAEVLTRAGRLVRRQAHFLKVAVVLISIANGPLTRVGAAEDCNLDSAIFVLALDPPITKRHAISKDLGLQVIVGHLHTPGWLSASLFRS